MPKYILNSEVYKLSEMILADPSQDLKDRRRNPGISLEL